MKKLSLEKLKLAPEEVLQRNQMSAIYGGSDSGGKCSDNVCTVLPCCKTQDTCYQGKCTLR